MLDVAYGLLVEDATWSDRVDAIRFAFAGPNPDWVPARASLEQELVDADAATAAAQVGADEGEELADVIDIVTQLNRFSVVRGG